MKPPRKNHPRRTRINSRLPAELRHRLAEHSATKGIYECEAIRAAVEQYLDGTSDMTLLYRRLDSMNRNLNRLHRTLDLHGEFIKEYVLVYLKNTPRLPAADQEATLREGARRYKSIIERVAASLSAGKTWIDDLPKEHLSPMLPHDSESGRSETPPDNRQ
jgi:predicted DNA-binding protein